MKWYRLWALGLTAVLLALAAPTAKPVFAADGDAKLTVVDRGTTGAGATVVLECTTSISPCALALVAGRFYDFTITEESWDPVYDIEIKLDPYNPASSEWPLAYRTHSELWSEPPCDASDFTYYNSNYWWENEGYCGNGNNGLYFVSMMGKANSLTDGLIGGYIRKGTSAPQKFVSVDYATL